MIVEARDLCILAAVPVVIPGCDDVLGTEEEKHEQKVIAGHRYAIGPGRIWLQPDIDRFILSIDCPFVSESRIVLELVGVPMC